MNSTLYKSARDLKIVAEMINLAAKDKDHAAVSRYVNIAGNLLNSIAIENTMIFKNRIVNEEGLSEIRKFLAAYHIKGVENGGDYFTRDMLRAWAADAEFQIAEGNCASIEINSWDSVSGCTETFTISAAGLDSEIINIEE